MAIQMKRRGAATSRRRPPPPLGPGGAWSLAFEDTFAGTSIDTTKWTPYWYDGDGSPLNGVNCLSSNVAVTGGNCVLTLSSAGNGACIHTTQAAGRYQMAIGDYAECRGWWPGSAALGMYNWSAFWTVGRVQSWQGTPVWPETGENDVNETAAGYHYINYHGGTLASPYDLQHAVGNDAPSGGPWYNGYHTYGVHRRSGFTDFYYDGVLKHTHATSEVTPSPHELFVDLKNYDAWGTTVTGTASQVKLDYIRAWTPA